MRLERIAHGSFSWSNPMLGITFWMAELRGTKPRKFLDIGVVWTDRSTQLGDAFAAPVSGGPSLYRRMGHEVSREPSVTWSR